MTQLHFHKEKNFFMDWLMFHDLSTGEIALWHTLMNTGNRLGQKRVFNMPTATLTKLTGLSKQGLMKARKRLMERGLIRYKKGSYGKAPVYDMIPLTEAVELYVYPGVTQKGTEKESRKLTSELTIHKEKIKKEKRSSNSEREAHQLMDMYDENIGKLPPLTEAEFIKWVHRMGAEAVQEALLITVKKGGRTFSYMEAILKEWQNAGLKSIQDVEGYEREKESGTNQKLIPFRKNSTKEAPNKEQSLEDWLKEEWT